MKKIKIVLIVLLLVLAGLQLANPEIKNKPYSAETDFTALTFTPPSTTELIKTACYDCHSNQSEMPWYSRLAPVSMWIAGHIEEGRSHLNFSAWNEYTLSRAAHKMEEAIEMIAEEEMPLPSYLIMHEEARLTPEERKELEAWFTLVKQIIERELPPVDGQ